MGDKKHRNLLCVLILLGIFNAVQSILPLMEGEDEDCDFDCEPENVPVCGNDGRTYDSRCEIDKAKCQGHPVEFNHRGKCMDNARCSAQRALLLEQGSRINHFVPECKPDGSYAEVQCHVSTGYCWCVDELGKPIRGSSRQNVKPNCATKGRKTNKRRSSRGRKMKKGCGTSDRANFNANLIDIFQSEYNRFRHKPSASFATDPLRDTHEKQVIQWKFDQLDGNHDTYLKKKELRDLKRMAKKIVKPKMCAKTFAKFCDLDQDKKISRSEWSVCVGVDINNEQVNAVAGFLEDAPKVVEEPTPPNVPVKSDIDWNRDQQMPRLRHEGHSSIREDKDEDDAKEELPDCMTARRTALDSQAADPSAGIYVPDCTAEGLYVRAQCHKSPQYCWCVHPRSGKPIKGTTTQGYKPDCAAARRDGKNFKGCSLHKKQEFLDELVQSFIKEILDEARNRSTSIDTPTPEKAARWKFASIDENSNSVLDKREWKLFKREWRSFQSESKQKKRLRKCWRNLPRFCDENDNQKITIDEWLACTSVTRDFKGGIPRNPQRRGKNPFSTILKSD